MSHPAYRISVNKAVDRCLFMDLIRFVERLNFLNINETEYYSLGGPFLLDLQLVHSNYPFLQLNSIEEDENTFLRQQKHVFCKNLKLFNKTSSNFINETEFDKTAIFWLDYTKLTKAHLDDLALLASKLLSGSIIKITFNASPPYKPIHDNKDAALLNFKQKFSSYMPAGILDFSDISEGDRFCLLAIEMVKYAASSLLRENREKLCFEFCDVVTYSDSSPMMSISGILLPQAERPKLQDALEKQMFFSPKTPQEINMPDLSILERHRINQLLPTEDVNELFRALGYPLEREEKEPWEKSLNKLRLYSRFWHRYPEFVKISL